MWTVLHGKVFFSGHPVFVNFHEYGGGQPQEGFVAGEDAGHTRTSLDFAIEPFDRVAGMHACAVP